MLVFKNFSHLKNSSTECSIYAKAQTLSQKCRDFRPQQQAFRQSFHFLGNVHKELTNQIRTTPSYVHFYSTATAATASTTPTAASVIPPASTVATTSTSTTQSNKGIDIKALRGSTDVLHHRNDKLPREHLINADPTGWWVSEKFDGVRAYWNGKGRLFYANGKEIKVPEFFTNGLPYHPLDGELWCGRGQFEKTVNIVKGTNPDAWKEVTYKIFDAPTQHNLKFEERIKFLKQHIPESHPYAKVVEPWICNGKESLLQQLSDYEKNGAEGLIIRKPNSYYYEKGAFLKVESYYDADALVTAHKDGEIVCKLPIGLEFSLLVQGPLPEVGSVITFKYNGTTDDKGLPQGATFYRTRPDLRWEDASKIKALPYRVGYGKPAGPLPKCRGCKQQLRDRNQLRITCTVMFTPPGSGPYPGQTSFCLNPHCVAQAIRDYGKKEVFLPPFDGKVGVDVADLKDKDLPQIEGISFHFNQ